MTQKEITKMLRKAEFNTEFDDYVIENRHRFEAFAKLVAAHEREACANVCESHIDGTPEYNQAAWNCAEAIRARGQQ